MLKMSFWERWVGLVMECISTVIYSNLLNKGLQPLFVAKGFCLIYFIICFYVLQKGLQTYEKENNKITISME